MRLGFASDFSEKHAPRSAPKESLPVSKLWFALLANTMCFPLRPVPLNSIPTDVQESNGFSAALAVHYIKAKTNTCTSIKEVANKQQHISPARENNSNKQRQTKGPGCGKSGNLHVASSEWLCQHGIFLQVHPSGYPHHHASTHIFGMQQQDKPAKVSD